MPPSTTPSILAVLDDALYASIKEGINRKDALYKHHYELLRSTARRRPAFMREHGYPRAILNRRLTYMRKHGRIVYSVIFGWTPVIETSRQLKLPL